MSILRSLPFDFAQPTLLALLPLPVLYLLLLLRGRLWSERWRKALALAVRTVLILLLVAALAGMQLAKKVDRLEVYYAVDVSESIPEPLKQKALAWTLSTSETMDLARDKAGLILFGKNAGIECLLSAPYTYGIERKRADTPADVRTPLGYRCIIESDETDIAEALDLAMAAFSGTAERRIVLITDGNATRGNVLPAARECSANGVRVDVLPIMYRRDKEVWISKILCPSRARLNEPFTLNVVLQSTGETELDLTISERRRGRTIARLEDLPVKAGKNVVPIQIIVPESGFNFFEVVIDPLEDTIAVNNRSETFTHVGGKHRVLYVEGDITRADLLIDALKKEEISCDLRSVDQVPTDALEFQDYDAIILSNVPAYAFSDAQMALMAHCVRDFGIGLVMIGGEHSFGPGGYRGTAIEQVLPVDMDIKQKRILLNGALALIMHTCEFDMGNKWAVTICKAAINALSDADYVGVVIYDWKKGGCSWHIPMQPAMNRSKILAQLSNMQPGDMPDSSQSINMAYKGLLNTKASGKHVVILSDGDPIPPPTSLLKRMVSNNITISTACISPHTAADKATMRQIAAAGGGRYYDVKNASSLPQIFVHEAAVLRRSLIVQEIGIQPVVAAASEIIGGFYESGVPAVDGMVLTSAKPGAEVPLVVVSKLAPKERAEQDPFLACWRCGLGRSAAFASDAKNRWGHRWVAWSGFSKFWGQVIRWVSRTTPNPNYQVSTDYADGTAKVVLESLDDENRPVNFLDVSATAYLPSGKKTPVSLSQTAPGRYEGKFPVSEVGISAVRLVYNNTDGSTGTQVAGLAVPYSREYAGLGTNLATIKQIAEATGGSILALDAEPPGELFLHTGQVFRATEQIWQPLLMASCVLLLIDVAVRRVVISTRQVREFGGRLAFWRKRAVELEGNALERLLRVHAESRSQPPAASPPPVAKRAPLPRAAQPALPPKPPAPAPKPKVEETPPPADSASVHERLLDAKRKAREEMEAQDDGDRQDQEDEQPD